MRALLPTLTAILLVICVPVAAQAKLPNPKSKVIRPNVGVGAVKLWKQLRPLPRGWRNPSRCLSREGLVGCSWAKRRDAHPPQGQLGIKGPYIYAAGTRRDVVQIALGAGDEEPDARPLRRWRTPAGIRIGSPLARVLAAYPGAVPGDLDNQYVILRGGRRPARTNFNFVNGQLHRIEINACTDANPVCDIGQ
jgi:hypothetical protein